MIQDTITKPFDSVITHIDFLMASSTSSTFVEVKKNIK